MADEKKDGAGDQEQPAPKKSLLDNKVVILGLIVVVQAIMAIGITQFVIVPRLEGNQSSKAAAEAVDPLANMSDMGVLVGLEEIIVTLQSVGHKGQANFLRININLEVDNQQTANLVASRLPQLRDIAIMTLSAKSANDLSTPEGAQAARSELYRKLAEKLPEGTLRNIYFSDLVIQ